MPCSYAADMTCKILKCMDTLHCKYATLEQERAYFISELYSESWTLSSLPLKQKVRHSDCLSFGFNPYIKAVDGCIVRVETGPRDGCTCRRIVTWLAQWLGGAVLPCLVYLTLKHWSLLYSLCRSIYYASSISVSGLNRRPSALPTRR